MTIPRQLMTVSYQPDVHTIVCSTSELKAGDLILIKRTGKRKLENESAFDSLHPAERSRLLYEARWRRVVRIKEGRAKTKVRGRYADGIVCWRDYLHTEEWYVIRTS